MVRLGNQILTKLAMSCQYKKSEILCPTAEKIKIIEEAIKNKFTANVVYLKANDEKSNRLIQPITIGEMQYLGKAYTGVKAFCLKRQEYRVFKVDRILEIKLS